MPGRYQFSLPERQQRDGWFRIGSIDITTTAFLVLMGVLSMFWYAIDSISLFKLAFTGYDVRNGEIWRIFTWPLVCKPDVFSAITLAFFWFVGHRVEDQIGRRHFTVLIAAMTIVPASLVTLVRFDPVGVYSLNLLALALLVVFALDNPSATSFFNIPIWIFAAVYVGIMILQYIGNGMYEALAMGVGVILIALGGARQYGMLGDIGFIPRLGGGKKPAKASKQKGSRSAGPTVVSGPWADSSPTHSPADEAELNGLLDKINDQGIDSLTRDEKSRLNDLSKKLRGR